MKYDVMKYYIRRIRFLAKIVLYRAWSWCNPKAEVSCSQQTLRCEMNVRNRHYGYPSFGQSTPTCCASHLVELLYFLDDIFQAHQIPYFLLWGTHLGALRHNGLIPWDTDGDIGIEMRYKPQVLELLMPQVKKNGYAIKIIKDEMLQVCFSPINALHIDIEFWRRDNNTLRYQDHEGAFVMYDDELYPLKYGQFYTRRLPIPFSTTYLTNWYGEDVFRYGAKKYPSLNQKKFLIQDFSPARIE